MLQEERERQRKEAEEAEAAEAAEAERKRIALEEEGERRQHEMAAAAAHTVSVTSPTDEGLCAVALYDYQAAADDEISFDPNELITNIEMVSFTTVLLICVLALALLLVGGGQFTHSYSACFYMYRTSRLI